MKHFIWLGLAFLIYGQQILSQSHIGLTELPDDRSLHHNSLGSFEEVKNKHLAATDSLFLIRKLSGSTLLPTIIVTDKREIESIVKLPEKMELRVPGVTYNFKKIDRLTPIKPKLSVINPKMIKPYIQNGQIDQIPLFKFSYQPLSALYQAMSKEHKELRMVRATREKEAKESLAFTRIVSAFKILDLSIEQAELGRFLTHCNKTTEDIIAYRSEYELLVDLRVLILTFSNQGDILVEDFDFISIDSI